MKTMFIDSSGSDVIVWILDIDNEKVYERIQIKGSAKLVVAQVKKVISDNKQGILRIFLKYDDNQSAVIHEIKRISKPGCRVYVGKDEVPRVKNGLGVSILSTSKGVMDDVSARRENIGGEVICTVW